MKMFLEIIGMDPEKNYPYKSDSTSFTKNRYMICPGW
jgi:hypothetical protein